MLTKGSTVLSTKEPKPESKEQGGCVRGHEAGRRAHLEGRDPAPGKGKAVAPPAHEGADGGDEEEEPKGASQASWRLRKPESRV